MAGLSKSFKYPDHFTGKNVEGIASPKVKTIGGMCIHPDVPAKQNYILR